jgi:hypothetical protein
VPSFSSKGFPDVQKIVEYSSELIDGVTLISAYDLHYKKVLPDVQFPSLLFLDSGGYEASKDWDLSDFQEREHTPETWTQEFHEAQLMAWKSSVPTVAISYDHPKERLLVKDQIARAKRMAPARDDFVREILLKPETTSQSFLPIQSVLDNIHGLSEFDIIGVTEKEIGSSLLERMKNIARIRTAMNKVDLHQPIHVFGSLDTISTPLYFLAGADIFDGLTWLRFAFLDGLTVYRHNFSALRIGAQIKSHLIEGRCWNHNYYYIKDLELSMRRFLADRDFGSFRYHSDFFKDTLQSVMEDLEK